MLSPYFQESINTMKAGWIELTCARLFGKRFVGKDGSFTVVTAQWRGKYYILEFKEKS